MARVLSRASAIVISAAALLAVVPNAVHAQWTDTPAAKQLYGAGFGFKKQKGKGEPRLRISADQWIELDPTGPQFVFRVPNKKRAADQLRKRGFTVTRQRHLVQVSDPDGDIFVFQ